MGVDGLGGALGIETVREAFTVDLSIPLRYCELGHEEIFVDTQGSGDTDLSGRLGTSRIGNIPACGYSPKQ